MSNAQNGDFLKAYLTEGSARTAPTNSRRDEEIQYILQVFLTAGDEARAEGDLVRAERFYHETIKLAVREFDDDVPEIALAKFHLSMIYLDRGTLIAADLFAKSALKIFIEVFGEGHPATGMALHHLAEVNLAQDRAEEAKPLKQQASQILSKHYQEYKNDSKSDFREEDRIRDCEKANSNTTVYGGKTHLLNPSNN